jgi:S1-C subfamily serine protease
MYIATNKHVIDEYGEFGFEVKFCSLWSQEHIPRYNDNFLGKYTYFWKPLKGKAFLVGYSEDLDFAILKFDFKDNNFKGEERYLFTSIPKFETNISNIGDIIYRWNTTSLSKKEINYVCDEYNIVDLDAECSLGEHFIKLNKSGIPGTSGSPYFNQNGQFVGIHVGSNQTHRVSFILPSYVLIEEYEKIIGKPLFYT